MEYTDKQIAIMGEYKKYLESTLQKKSSSQGFYNPSSYFDNVGYTQQTDPVTGQVNNIYTLTGNNESFLSAFRGGYSEANMMLLFQSIPELFGIVKGFADRVSNGEYTLVDKDDNEVDNNELWNKIKEKPNCDLTFKEFIWLAVVYKMMTGNVYGYRFIPDTLPVKHKYIKDIKLLPSHYVLIHMKAPRPSPLVVTSTSDFVDAYQCVTGGVMSQIPPQYIVHNVTNKLGAANDVITGKGVSIFKAAELPLSNLAIVYEARGVIYRQRGSLGILVSNKTDVSGNIALRPGERQELEDDMYSDYGVSNGKKPIAITNQPVNYIKTGANILELAPFEETLADTVAIAGVAGMPMALIPKVAENKQTNLDVATRDFYTDSIIPMAVDICQFLTELCCFDELDLKIKVSFDDIPALQDDALKQGQALYQNAQAAELLYAGGHITGNEVRSLIGHEPVDGGDDYIDEEERLSRLRLPNGDEVNKDPETPPDAADPNEEADPVTGGKGKKTLNLFKKKKVHGTR